MFLAFNVALLVVVCCINGALSFTIQLRAKTAPGKFISACPPHRSKFQISRDPLMALRPPARQTKQTQVKDEDPIAALLKSLLPDFKNVKLQSATNALIATNLAISLTGTVHSFVSF